MSENNGETVTITLEEYKELRKSDGILNALYNAGIDNWEGYEEADIWDDEGSLRKDW